ncbi:MAG: SDR family NAD(P)-dependent oxidoreductase [Deltaproteobacteria bacterium]|nr:MAG: SDR family NAD(P)-dependent oxidoreductase [Deltaproteobacteria bacterium]
MQAGTEERRMHDGPRTAQPKLLVTGACGFIGANLCHYFAERGWRVYAIAGPKGRSWRLPAQAAATVVRVDLLDADAVCSAVQAIDPNFIVNCAAFGAYASQQDAPRIYQVNVLGLRNLLEAARRLDGLGAVVQLGSSSEYGANCQGPAETAPCWPDSDYAVSKVAATALTRLFAHKHGLRAFALRLYSVYGPYEDMSRLIPQLTLKARKGQWPPLVGRDISRDFVYVDDVCRAIAMTCERAPQLLSGDVFNIGSGVCCTLEDLVLCAQQVFGVQRAPVWGSMPQRHWDHTRWYGNPTHAHTTLGWRSETSLRDGLQRTMAWVEDHPHLIEAARQNTVLGAV